MSKDLPTEMMRNEGHDHFAAIAKDNASFREAAGLKGTLEHTAEGWAARDNESYRGAFRRRDNPWCMQIPNVMPEPAMDGQRLHWGQNICGLWQYKDYLAINGKWVDMDPTDYFHHPMSGWICK